MIYLDGVKLEESYETPSLLELVAAVEEAHVPKGNIIIEVVVNGDSLEEFTEADGTLLRYDPEAEIKIVTSSLNDIMAKSLIEFESYLTRLVPGLKDIATLFRGGSSEDANKFYAEAIDGVRVMIELIQGMSSSGSFDFNTKEYNGRSLLDMTEDLKVAVQRLVEAQASADDSEIAHLLESSLTEQLNGWLQIMPQLREKIGG